MQTFSLRLTLDNDDLVKSLLKHYTTVLCCKEDPDTDCTKIHYHALIDSDLKLPTLRARIKIHFGADFKGNAHYQLKQTDTKDKAIKYLCKGLSKTKPPLIIYNTYGIDHDEQHQQYWETRENVKHETKTKPKENCIQFILDLYNNPPHTNTHIIDNKRIKSTKFLTEGEICDTMLKWYTDQGYPIPHRTTGESIIKQCVYELNQVENKDSILHSYYGIRFNL